MQKLISLFVAMLIIVTHLFAQSGVRGIIKDGKGVIISEATVSLLKTTDSSWLQSQLTDDKGEFRFSDVKEGNYLLHVQAAGYQRFFQPVTTSGNEMVIALQQISKELKELTLVSKTPRIEKGLGKTTLNFEQTANQGDNVLDLLRKSPGVNVANGNISMKGTGALVLIDDKQTYLDGQDLEEYLKSLPADQVASLELITQPSSKYDAEGVGGIINIKTRKIKKRGVNGSIAVAGEQGFYGNTHNNANLTYRNNKLTLYANAGYLAVTGCLNREDARKVTDQQTGVVNTDTRQTAFMKETFSDVNLKLGADYNINDKTTVGGNAKGVYHPNKEGDATRTVLNNPNGDVIYNNTDIEQGLIRKYVAGNAYIKYAPAKDHEINADVDYFNRYQQGGQLVLSNNYEGSSQWVSTQNLRDDKLSKIEVTVGKVDYSGKLSDDCKLEAGVKCSYAALDKNDYFEKESNGSWSYDTQRSNHFVYSENINAAYLSATKSFGKKWNTQLGVRAEQTVSKGDQITQNKQFDNNYVSLFPTVLASYKIDDKNSVEVSCGRRVERPAYTQLDPFITYFTQYFYHAGNPNLSPTFRNYVDLNYNHNDKLFTSIGCGKVYGVITPVMDYNTAANAVFATWGNFADRIVVHGSVSCNRQLQKWWLFSAEGNVYYNGFYAQKGNRLLAESLGYSLNIDNQFTFKHGWSADTSFYYSSGDLQNLIDRYGRNYWLGFNVSKKIMKDSATIRLSVQDPFNMYNPTSTSDWNGIETASSLRFNSQTVGLGFTYNFGKKLDGVQQRQSNSEEAGRM